MQVTPAAARNGAGESHDLLEDAYDGDKCQSPMAYTEEANEEVRNYFKKRSSFVSVKGTLMVSANIPTVSLVVANMTGDPIN